MGSQRSWSESDLVMLGRFCRHLCWLDQLQEKPSPLAQHGEVLCLDQAITMSTLAKRCLIHTSSA